uniref:Tripartite motif containing 25 n=1 Tax=Naja naja TaxID=35670 RepID=A0A8C6X316_NAJNA
MDGKELTCSICLCLFQTPVTTPCGHNFCLPCLEMTWMEFEEKFSCPQCRASFETRPELKKNTVLCRVVEQFQISQDGLSKGTCEEKREKADSSPTEPRSPSPVVCDSCLVVDATKTCLTCMASFCQEHLGPHLESPAFKCHQLVPPVKELQQQKCQSHTKLLEFFCQEHRVPICCFCLLSHKTCSTTPLKEAKEFCVRLEENVRYKSQLYISTPNQISDALSLMTRCLDAVQIWMSGNMLRLNPAKTEWLCIPASRPSQEYPSLAIGGEVLPPVDRARNLGVLLDVRLRLEEQVGAVARGAFAQLRLVRQLRPFLDRDALRTVTHALVTSRLDYFATQFTLDRHTAHKNIVLMEKCTKMSVTETVQDYKQHPQRFLSFSQVLSFQCFKKGIHYWEVDLENNNFCAVGICYGSIPRRGPESRLGRNSSSWCIEWVNNKVSAWHNDKDTCLPTSKATKIGVLLNYDGGFKGQSGTLVVLLGGKVIIKRQHFHSWSSFFKPRFHGFLFLPTLFSDALSMLERPFCAI